MREEKSSVSPPRRKNYWALGGVLLGVSIWMFTLGVLVGRGRAPVTFDIPKLEQTLLAERRQAEQKEAVAISETVQEGVAETSSERLDLEQPKQVPPESRLPEKSPKEDLGPPPKQAAPAAEPPSRPAQAQPVAPGKYTVQVASLRSRESADTILAKLLKKGFSAVVVPSSSSDSGTWYRIRIGNYQKKEEADKIAQKITKESFNPIVVKKN